MRTKTLVLCLVLAALPLLAQHDGQMTPDQQEMMEAWQKAATPSDAHRALDGMVGSWDVTMKMWHVPGAPPEQSTGFSENRWILGGRYVEQRFTGKAMGQAFEGIGYTGYDNVRKQYTGSWFDNMSTAVMSMSGTVEPGGKIWKFKGSMDDPMTGKAMALEQKITIVSNDKHLFEMWSPGPDGKMFKSMELTYTRRK